MGRPSSKSSVEKEKLSNTRSFIQENVQRRFTNVTSTVRRRATMVMVGDYSQDLVSEDGDVERLEQHIGTDKKISLTRSSIVSQFADKLSPNEYKSNAHRKTNLYSNSQVPRNRDSIAPEKNRKFDEGAIKAIILDSRSFGDFRRVGVQSFLQVATPGYKGPTARTVQRNLKILYNDKKKALIQQLKNIQHISITTDTWCSGRKRHYLYITAHFVSSHYEQRGTILSFCQFHGRSFAMRLRRHPKVKQTICEISSSSSAANGETNDEEDSSDNNSGEESIADRSSNHDSSDEQSSQEDSDGVQDLDSADDWSDSDDEEIVALGLQDVDILMTKCRKFIVTIRKSSILNDAFRKLARDVISIELVQDMKIHWSSTFKMIQRLLLYQNVLGTFYDNLDTIDGVTAGQCKKIIESKPTKWFNDTTEILSDRSYPALSLAYPVIYSLNNYLNDRTGDATENAAKEIMVARFDEYILPELETKHAVLRSVFAPTRSRHVVIGTQTDGREGFVE
ncbi:unnamed protein product [Adineta ricciae]|uniref:Uncharacterized protein n=1 Tax=Adineta ricciae TaxID=249248 RepID=A0A815RGQ0_ADIRI|nr:unnamed protein product [Adineta ricciae]CAF1661659.1 unnamed protein product [Adineta ricciae]